MLPYLLDTLFSHEKNMECKDKSHMHKKAWPSRIIGQYALLQTPALVLLILLLALVQRWVNLPALFIWGLIALWVAKDIILFFFTWRAYDSSHKGPANAMIGRQGIAQNRLAPSGYIHVRGELWQAEIEENSLPVEKGKRIRIYGNRGLTLLMHGDNKEDNEDRG
jgi:membrane protein implicated in regulation of membrane protease activity